MKDIAGVWYIPSDDELFVVEWTTFVDCIVLHERGISLIKNKLFADFLKHVGAVYLGEF